MIAKFKVRSLATQVGTCLKTRKRKEGPKSLGKLSPPPDLALAWENPGRGGR